MTKASSPETMRLLAWLKRIYRSSGIRYATAAQRIGVSEMTIKRAMAGKGLSVAMLEKLCGIANITMLELLEYTRSDAEPLPEMNVEQADAVASNPLWFMTMLMLDRNWSVAHIQQEFEVDEPTMVRCLTALDRIGVITLFPGLRVRVLCRMSRQKRNALSAQRISHFFRSIDLSSRDNAWGSGTARLSPASFIQASQRIEAMQRDLQLLTDRDLELPSDKTRWYALFAAIQPVPLQDLLAIGQLAQGAADGALPEGTIASIRAVPSADALQSPDQDGSEPD